MIFPQFNEGYTESESGTAIYFDLANAGFAVIAFDAASFGSRGYEFNGALGGAQGGDGTPLFYRRYPTWSLLGKIVHDGLAALDLARVSWPKSWPKSGPSGDPPHGMPGLDGSKLFVVGYDVGGRAALYMGATDTTSAGGGGGRRRGKRVKGIVSINGYTPMRSDTNSSPTGGIRRLWDWHALQPALGFFDGREAQLPFDMEDVLVEASGNASETQLLIYQQEFDRENSFAGVKASVERARRAGAAVELLSAPTVNMLNDDVHAAVIRWLKDKAGLAPNSSGDCARGKPDNMTPLRLVSCADPALVNHTQFEIVGGVMRLAQCPNHAAAVDCTQAGGMAACGKLAQAEKMILSGPLRANPDLENFHFAYDPDHGTITFKPVPPSAFGGVGIHKCLEGSGMDAQIVSL